MKDQPHCIMRAVKIMVISSNFLLGMSDIQVNIRDENDRTRLYVACEESHPDIVQQLLQHEDVVVVTNRELFTACMNHNEQIVNMILFTPYGTEKRYTLVHETACDQQNALHTACKHAGHATIVQHFFTYVDNVDVNAIDEDGHTPLHLTCSHIYHSYIEKFAILKILLQQPLIQLSKKTNQGQTALDLI
jgi:ankyrin repeat protein